MRNQVMLQVHTCSICMLIERIILDVNLFVDDARNNFLNATLHFQQEKFQ